MTPVTVTGNTGGVDYTEQWKSKPSSSVRPRTSSCLKKQNKNNVTPMTYHGQVRREVDGEYAIRRGNPLRVFYFLPDAAIATPCAPTRLSKRLDSKVRRRAWPVRTEKKTLIL